MANFNFGLQNEYQGTRPTSPLPTIEPVIQPTNPPYIPPPPRPQPPVRVPLPFLNIAGQTRLTSGVMISPNYKQNETGWAFDAEGNLEANKGKFRGRFEIGGTTITQNNTEDIQTNLDIIETAGGGTLYLQPGTYLLTADILIPSGVTLQGVSRDNVIINCNTSYAVKIAGTNVYSTGTVTIANGETTVVGTGTTWTSAMVGRYILLDGLWYEITAFTDTTHITIDTYEGDNLVGMVAKVMTPNGDAQIDTAQKKFGISSGLFDGIGDFITTPDSTDWTLGTGKFSIDCWVRFSANDTHLICGQYDDADDFWGFNASTVGNILGFTSITNGTYDIAFHCSVTLDINIWYHVAVVRDGTTEATWHLFVDGVKQTNVLDAGAYTGTIKESSGTMNIGNINGNLANPFEGWIDEYRLSKGIARWTGNFTPPTLPYDTDTYTKLLLHFEGIDTSTTFIDSAGLSSPFVIADTNFTGKLREITVQNATGSGVVVQYAMEPEVIDVNVFDCGTGLDFDYVTYIQIQVTSSGNGVNLNMNFVNGFYINFSDFSLSTTGAGIIMTDSENATFFNSSNNDNTGDGMNLTNVTKVAFLSYDISGNGGQGIEMVSGCSDNQISSGIISKNSSDGIKLTASSSRNSISLLSILSNGGYGINIAVATCENNTVISPIYNANVSGTLNNSGTNTTIL